MFVIADTNLLLREVINSTVAAEHSLMTDEANQRYFMGSDYVFYLSFIKYVIMWDRRDSLRMTS